MVKISGSFVTYSEISYLEIFGLKVGDNYLLVVLHTKTLVPTGDQPVLPVSRPFGFSISRNISQVQAWSFHQNYGNLL